MYIGELSTLIVRFYYTGTDRYVRNVTSLTKKVLFEKKKLHDHARVRFVCAVQGKVKDTFIQNERIQN